MDLTLIKGKGLKIAGLQKLSVLYYIRGRPHPHLEDSSKNYLVIADLSMEHSFPTSNQIDISSIV